MIFEKVKEIKKMKLELEKELSKLSAKEAIIEISSYKQAALDIENYFSSTILSGTGWLLDVREHDESIRFWNHSKSRDLPDGSYCHVFFDHNFNLIESTASDEDISEIQEILNNTKK